MRSAFTRHGYISTRLHIDPLVTSHGTSDLDPTYECIDTSCSFASKASEWDNGTRRVATTPTDSPSCTAFTARARAAARPRPLQPQQLSVLHLAPVGRAHNRRWW